jgi:hypothetical protein
MRNHRLAMRNHRLAALGSATLALAAAASFLPSASASSVSGGPAAGKPESVPCYVNTNPADDTGFAVPAQSATAANPTMDTKGAVLVRADPYHVTCAAMDSITAYGYLLGGPVTGVNIEIKADVTGGGLGHHPGATLAGPYNNLPTTVGSSSPYSTVTAAFPAFTLTSGTRYWVQMQVKMNPRRGSWNWEVVRPDPEGNGDTWRNPGGGVGCGYFWKHTSAACLGSIQGKDLMTEIDF